MKDDTPTHWNIQLKFKDKEPQVHTLQMINWETLKNIVSKQYELTNLTQLHLIATDQSHLQVSQKTSQSALLEFLKKIKTPTLEIIVKNVHQKKIKVKQQKEIRVKQQKEIRVKQQKEKYPRRLKLKNGDFYIFIDADKQNWTSLKKLVDKQFGQGHNQLMWKKGKETYWVEDDQDLQKFLNQSSSLQLIVDSMPQKLYLNQAQLKKKSSEYLEKRIKENAKKGYKIQSVKLDKQLTSKILSEPEKEKDLLSHEDQIQSFLLNYLYAHAEKGSKQYQKQRVIKALCKWRAEAINKLQKQQQQSPKQLIVPIIQSKVQGKSERFECLTAQAEIAYQPSAEEQLIRQHEQTYSFAKRFYAGQASYDKLPINNYAKNIFNDALKQLVQHISLGDIEDYEPKVRSAILPPFEDNDVVGILGGSVANLEDVQALLEWLVYEEGANIIIHLGNSSKAGLPQEFEEINERLKQFQKQSGRQLRFYSLAGNQDYYTFGRPFHNYISENNLNLKNRQDRAYFCLRNKSQTLQFIGLNTGKSASDVLRASSSLFGGVSLNKKEARWALDRIQQFGGKTVLLTHHPLFTVHGQAVGKWAPSAQSAPNVNPTLFSQLFEGLPKITCWISGHEPCLTAYKTNSFGINRTIQLGNTPLQISKEHFDIRYPCGDITEKIFNQNLDQNITGAVFQNLNKSIYAKYVYMKGSQKEEAADFSRNLSDLIIQPTHTKIQFNKTYHILEETGRSIFIDDKKAKLSTTPAYLQLISVKQSIKEIRINTPILIKNQESNECAYFDGSEVAFGSYEQAIEEEKKRYHWQLIADIERAFQTGTVFRLYNKANHCFIGRTSQSREQNLGRSSKPSRFYLYLPPIQNTIQEESIRYSKDLSPQKEKNEYVTTQMMSESQKKAQELGSLAQKQQQSNIQSQNKKDMEQDLHIVFKPYRIDHSFEKEIIAIIDKKLFEGKETNQFQDWILDCGHSDDRVESILMSLLQMSFEDNEKFDHIQIGKFIKNLGQWRQQKIQQHSNRQQNLNKLVLPLLVLPWEQTPEQIDSSKVQKFLLSRMESYVQYTQIQNFEYKKYQTSLEYFSLDLLYYCLGYRVNSSVNNDGSDDLLSKYIQTFTRNHKYTQGNFIKWFGHVSKQKIKSWFRFSQYRSTPHQQPGRVLTRMEEQQFGVFRVPDDEIFCIVGDWGTGEQDAKDLLEFLVNQYEATTIMHLGDVYYAGATKQFTKISNFINNYIRHRYPGVRYWTIPGNHCLYSQGGPFYHHLTSINQPFGHFSIRTENNKLQFIGINTAQYEHSIRTAVNPQFIGTRLEDSEYIWLQNRINQFEGRTILLSHHQMFSIYDRVLGRSYQIGRRYPNIDTRLSSQLFKILPKIMAWIWGHEHRCCKFPRNYYGINCGILLGNSSFHDRKINFYQQNYNNEVVIDSNYRPQRGIIPNVDRAYYNHTGMILQLNQDVEDNVNTTYVYMTASGRRNSTFVRDYPSNIVATNQQPIRYNQNYQMLEKTGLSLGIIEERVSLSTTPQNIQIRPILYQQHRRHIIFVQSTQRYLYYEKSQIRLGNYYQQTPQNQQKYFWDIVASQNFNEDNPFSTGSIFKLRHRQTNRVIERFLENGWYRLGRSQNKCEFYLYQRN